MAIANLLKRKGKISTLPTCSPERRETKETDIKAAPGPAESHRTTNGLRIPGSSS